MYDADGEPQPVQSAKGRALLAALLLEPGRVVSVDALKDALWGGAPPASAHASLQNHVTRLRRLLDDPERLRAVPPGYRLRVADGELDVRVFEQLVAQARAAHAERDWDGCASAASGALALWRGTPLGGLPADAAGHALVPRLEEARLLALELRYDAELATGAGGGGLVPELAELVAEYPLREAFHRQLMLVLHRTGRQAEALAVHRELRRRLVDELGVEPGAAVREAHREVLQEPAGAALGGLDTALAGRGRGAASGAGRGVGSGAGVGGAGSALGLGADSGLGRGVASGAGRGVASGSGVGGAPASGVGADSALGRGAASGAGLGAGSASGPTAAPASGVGAAGSASGPTTAPASGVGEASAAGLGAASASGRGAAPGSGLGAGSASGPTTASASGVGAAS
ncbi:AfsR/SARP family transcriptional regulator, partial [Streptomyces rectiviolaceus]|uniref:AfsR/SARP family transcriptional regulator n=1 Tax=Streptomyces rectiviolaceus TaxID=332591 RepID=UPI0031D34E4C